MKLADRWENFLAALTAGDYSRMRWWEYPLAWSFSLWLALGCFFGRHDFDERKCLWCGDELRK